MRNKILILFLLVGFTVFSQVKIRINDTASSGSTDDQVLTLVGNTLSLEDGGSSIDLSGYLDNNEVVSGVVSGSNLTLTMSDASTVVIDVSSLVGGGGGVSVPVEDEGSQITAAVTKFNFTGAGVTATNLSDDVTINIPGGAVSGNNPNITVASTLTDITNAGAGAVVELIEPITLTGNYTFPANQHLIFNTGSIDLDGFTLTGNNTSWQSSRRNEIVFDAFSGTIAGTWLVPYYVYSTQFGLKNDGYKYYETGSITSGSTTLTVSDGNFTSDDVGDFIAVRQASSGFLIMTGTIDVTEYNSNNSLQTTIASVTNSTTVELSTAATANATNVDVWTGSDNFNAGKNFIYMRNQDSGNIVFDPGIYFKSRIDEPGTENPETNPASWTFGFGTDDITMYAHGATIHMIPHAEYSSKAIILFNTHRFKWYGGVLHGENEMHNYSNENPGLPDEGCHGFVPASLVNNVHVEGVDMSGFMGDNIIGAGSLQFTNLIKGSAASGYPGDAEFEAGGLNISTGATEVDADYYRTDTFLDVTGFQFENTRQMHPTRRGRRLYQFSGSSFAGWSGLKTPRYRAFYYDSSNTFIAVTKQQEFYDIYELPDSVAKVKIVIDAVDDATVIDTQLRAPVVPENLTMVNVNSYDAARHGAANLPNSTTWRDSEIRSIGNTPPAYAINIEDYRRSARNYHFENLVIKDCYNGGINLVGTVNVNIVNCKIEAATYPGRLPTTSTLTNAIGTDFGRNVHVSGNTIIGGSVVLGRSDKFTDNILINGYVQSEANGVYIADNQFHNSEIRNLAYDAGADRELNWVENNKFTFDDDFSAVILDRNMTSILRNNEVRFNHKARVTSQIGADDAFEPIILGANSGNKIYNTLTHERDFGGYIEGMKLYGARGALASRDFTSQTIMVQDIDGLYAEMELSIGSGPIKDVTLKDIEIDGWLWISLNNYSGTLSSPTTVTMEDFYIHVDAADYNWTNTGSNVFKTEAKNFNLVAKDGIIELNAPSTVIGSANRYIDLNHPGTTIFQDVIFRSTDNTSVPFDLTNTNIFPASLGAVTFIDCEFDGVNSPVLRSGDKQLFTRPSADLESYADDAAATTGGIPATGEYLYWNTTNNALDVNG